MTKPGHFSAYVVTDDPDALHARAVAHGVKVTQEPHDTDYGSRDFAVEDPERNRWSFGTYRGTPR
ncbi:MAG TPA: VOC family protein [Trebonia sp.]|nr:VOC family protein [Trebonia sp.]